VWGGSRSRRGGFVGLRARARRGRGDNPPPLSPFLLASVGAHAGQVHTSSVRLRALLAPWRMSETRDAQRIRGGRERGREVEQEEGLSPALLARLALAVRARARRTRAPRAGRRARAPGAPLSPARRSACATPRDDERKEGASLALTSRAGGGGDLRNAEWSRRRRRGRWGRCLGARGVGGWMCVRGGRGEARLKKKKSSARAVGGAGARGRRPSRSCADGAEQEPPALSLSLPPPHTHTHTTNPRRARTTNRQRSRAHPRIEPEREDKARADASGAPLSLPSSPPFSAPPVQGRGAAPPTDTPRSRQDGRPHV
jgi:hypothetical protein